MIALGAAQPDERVLALTFDDGPNPTYTPAILDVLKSHGVKATFFVLGQNAARYPDLIDRIRDEGHVLASHTWAHPKLTTVSDQVIIREIESTQRELAAHGVVSKCVRPPYGATNAHIQTIIRDHAQDSRTVLWSIDSNDWRRPAAGVIADNVSSRFRPGAIILMHDGGGDRSRTVQALDMVIRRAKDAGYGFGVICK